MNSTDRRWIILLAAVSAMASLPLVGVWAAGRSIEPYLEFPPRPRFVLHAPFSWPIFLALSVGVVSVVIPFASRLLSVRQAPPFQAPRPPRGRFPWWGWAGAVWTSAAWMCAWNRWAWVGEWQLHTFTPLWLGYIVVVNGLTVARTGSSVMIRHPGSFLLLFPLSAVFWWTFEYLNRFVQNWYYVGGRDLTFGEYILHATVPFSTVLPAVISTADCVSTYPRLIAGLERAWPLRIAASRQAGWAMALAAAGGLIGIGLWPGYFFPLVWVAPLLLIAGLQLACGEPSIFSPAARGDWRLLWVAALGSLICGLFWELWNSRSLAHWEYAIPFAHRFEVFEMPLLGYAGYLPFGLVCLAVVQLVVPADWIRMRAEHQPDPDAKCAEPS